jgi:hypothetical protein
MRGMSMFTQDPIRVARLFSDIDKSNRDLQYIMLSDVDNDDLRTACEFYINREMLPFKNDSVSSNTRVMVWKHESAHRLQKWLGLGDDHSRYMGTALPLAVVGIKYDMPRVNIVQGRRNGVYTFRDVTAMDLMEVEKYMGSRINLRSTIRFNEYEILEESNICEVVAYDEDCNMMNVRWQWAKYGGTIGTLLHIVSPAYMLRELFTDKYRTYLLGGSLFEAFVPFHQALRTSQMAVMLMELCDNGVTEEYLMSKNEEFGWGCQDILSLLADILENVIRSEEVHSVMESFQFREERTFVPEEGGFVRSTRITLTDEHIRTRMLDKIAYAVLQERGEQERKIPVLKGNLLNYYLRDQYISVDGYLNYVCDVRNGKIIVEQRMPRDLPDYYTMCDYEISIRALEREMDIFETSSPSYPLLASLDACTGLLEAEGYSLFRGWQQRLSDFYKGAAALRRFRILGREAGRLSRERAFAYDPGKILIACPPGQLTGHGLARLLRERYLLETEMVLEDCVLAMTSPADAPDALQRLLEALLELEGSLEGSPRVFPDPEEAGEDIPLLPAPETVLPVGQAVRMDMEAVPLAAAAGRICGEYLYCYPPGIPVCAPGERITDRVLSRIRSLEASGCRIRRSQSGAGDDDLDKQARVYVLLS